MADQLGLSNRKIITRRIKGHNDLPVLRALIYPVISLSSRRFIQPSDADLLRYPGFSGNSYRA